MEKDQKGISYLTKWITQIIINGLFWQGVRNNLAKIGLDFMPYYWELGCTNIKPPQIRDDISKYQLSIFGEEEISVINQNVIGIGHKDLLSDLRNGDVCLGMKKEGRIAIYSFIKLRSFDFRGRSFEIKPVEGYVFNTYTFEDFRGKNLAPYLRYQSYEYFKDKGIERYYSISEYFNKPTLRYKKKLNVSPLKLYLSLILFKRWTMNFKLKTYR